jgi:sec-independent protein translocase protein TatC
MSTIATDVRGFAAKPGWRDYGRQARRVLVETSVICGALLSEMSFLDHLEELRKRLLRSIIAIAAAVVICLTYAVNLIALLRTPVDRVPDIQLIAIEATEIFSLYFKAAFLAAVCVAAPFVLWQAWQFIAPGLYKHERRYAGPFLISTTVFFAIGAAFGFTVLLPLALQMIVVLANPVGIRVSMSTLSYFDFVTTITLSMGIVVEIPPVIFVLSRIGLVNARLLARNFQYALLLSFVVAAVVTPTTDATNMLLVAIPMIALYAAGIVVALLFGRKRRVEV